MAWLALGTTVRELPADGEVVVGSGADADWRVLRADLMPRHFVVSVHGAAATVRANTTDNVVVVNGQQLVVEPTPLRDGDTILAGNGRFAFTLAAPTATVVEHAARESAFLVDDAANVAHPLIDRSTTIGRDASNAIVVRDATASRFHADVKREAGGFALHAMGASGTSLNGKLVRKPWMLAEGDIVEIAFVKLRFTREAPAGALAVAMPHSTKDDEAGRKPTLIGGPTVPDTGRRPQGVGAGSAVSGAGSGAGGGAQRILIVVALVVVALAVVLWFARSGT